MLYSCTHMATVDVKGLMQAALWPLFVATKLLVLQSLDAASSYAFMSMFYRPFVFHFDTL